MDELSRLKAADVNNNGLNAKRAEITKGEKGKESLQWGGGGGRQRDRAAAAARSREMLLECDRHRDNHIQSD